MVFPGLRRNLPTCILISGIIFLSAVAGYELNQYMSGSTMSLVAPPRGGRGGEGGGGEGGDTNSGEVEYDDRPRCGTEYAIAGGTGYGGHNEGLGCVNVG